MQLPISEINWTDGSKKNELKLAFERHLVKLMFNVVKFNWELSFGPKFSEGPKKKFILAKLEDLGG